jgi:hypothetical protein
MLAHKGQRITPTALLLRDRMVCIYYTVPLVWAYRAFSPARQRPLSIRYYSCFSTASQCTGIMCRTARRDLFGRVSVSSILLYERRPMWLGILVSRISTSSCTTLSNLLRLHLHCYWEAKDFGSACSPLYTSQRKALRPRTILDFL